MSVFSEKYRVLVCLHSVMLRLRGWAWKLLGNVNTHCMNTGREKMKHLCLKLRLKNTPGERLFVLRGVRPENT